MVGSRSMVRRDRPLLLVVAVGHFLTLLEHIVFGLVVRDFCRCRRLLPILGVVIRVFVVGVLVLRVAVGVGCHGCESCRTVTGTQSGLAAFS